MFASSSRKFLHNADKLALGKLAVEGFMTTANGVMRNSVAAERIEISINIMGRHMSQYAPYRIEFPRPVNK